MASIQSFILIPDSYKGTLSAISVCRIMEGCIREHYPDSKTISIPVADGGEGTVEAFLYAEPKGVAEKCKVQDPYGKSVEVLWGRFGQTAVIEMAASAGLALAGTHPNPGTASTFGVGESIIDALNKGCHKILVGLGGSCTNDGGCGLAAALGVQFLDADGNRFVPTGSTLKKIHHINMSHLDQRIGQTSLIGLCDVNNPLFGPCGAAYVFAPQKGADNKMVAALDEGLQHLNGIVERDLGFKGAEDAASGAAGGCGFGMRAFLGAQLQSGIETLLDFMEFDRLLADADCVFTGEGRLDSQSLNGKAISGIARHAQKAGVPVIAVAGQVTATQEQLQQMGIAAAYQTDPGRSNMNEIKKHATEDLARTMKQILEHKPQNVFPLHNFH